MSNIEIILIALSLSMDAFAVSISSGGTMKSLNLKNAFKMAFFFGGFQALMPTIGYFAGLSILSYISSFDHWIAFGILCAIGIKMIYEAYKLKEIETEKDKPCPFKTYNLLILSIATSIDALSIGLTFSFIKNSLISTVFIIGAITFLMSLAGIKIGYAGRHFFENKMEFIGGIILILLGFKILIQHLL